MDSRAVTAVLKVALNLESELRREIVLHVIRQLPTNCIAIDFYDPWFA
jgi:hypothetical protein